MGPRDSNSDDGEIFSDGLDSHTGDGSSEPSRLPSPPRNPEHSQSPSGNLSPATTIRSRPIRRGSWDKEPTDLSFTSSIGSTSDLTKIKNNEESTITAASNDDPAGDSARSVVNIGDPSSNLFQSATGLAIKTIGFQINLFIRFITFPAWFLFHSLMFYFDPFRKLRAGKMVISWISGVFCGRVSPLYIWLKERTIIWKAALRCAWGFLWLIYVCCILLCLMVSSLVISGFILKFLSEEPITKREVLNFDYTKLSPVAYVPIISCSGAGNDWENNMEADRKRMTERVIPTQRKLKAMISLMVPESEYNKNLGVFQIRVDYLNIDGKIIASSSMPYMLRFRSGPIRLILSFLKIVPLITGYISETQTLNVQMKDFIERDVPTSCLKVTLQQRAELQSGGGIPDLYEAYLVLESELPFFKRIAWHWKKTLYVWITVMLFIMESLFVLLCCRPIIFPIKRQRGGSARSTAKPYQSS